MTVTRSDVARRAGVSPAVVSYVLNNGPRPVARSTRERVEQAIADLNYRPNAVASALRGGRTMSVGYITPDTQNPYFAELGEAIESAFLTRGYLVLTGNTYFELEREQRYLRAFVDRQVDALVFSSGISVGSSELAARHRVPCLFMDTYGTATAESVVRSDDVGDSATAVDHLQGHGHSLIACIGGQVNVAADDARIAGWRGQQVRAGLPAGDELVAYAEMSEQGGYLAAIALLTEHGRPMSVHGSLPTALFVSSDVQAIGALFACAEIGLRVPTDVAIVSMGGTKAARFTLPPLTAMRQDVKHLAELTATHLIDRALDYSTPSIQIEVQANLVIGRSCGC